ncbi:MAG: murein L,D-transpeptidase YcbB/YkuD [Myxococcota bacterium]
MAQEHRGIENVDDLFWGDDVDTALADARANVQLSQKSRRRRLDRHLRRALAVPVEKRITTIERDLRRLRQSERNDHHYLVYVNLPEYHGEIWAGANLVHRFRVVVGGKRRINSTPRITSKIHTVIFNPFWNVPRRIYQTEMKGAADKWIEEGNGTEPKDYWASKGYELKGRNPKTQWLRRPPGRGNPLGKVKFLFENRHAVFLHDTPSKKLFRKPRRAFSHGCIRVQHPVEFAEQLLRRDGSWDVAQSEGVMHHYRRTPIRLRRPVPLVLDYITTRVTEDGHVMFLSDLYKLARPRRK